MIAFRRSLVVAAAAGVLMWACGSFCFGHVPPCFVAGTSPRGGLVVGVHMNGRPPAVIPRDLHLVLPRAGTSKVLDNVPAWTWCYGCANTAAGIICGYYDRHGYPDIYTGPANGGVCPLNNETAWPDTLPDPQDGESPIAASHKGIDGRTTRGHVDDFWSVMGSMIDPYKDTSPGWAIHSPLDCTGDYMWTSWGLKHNSDGDTQFFSDEIGWQTTDYTLSEPGMRDGAHGWRLFLNYRGYNVVDCYNQLILPTPVGHTNTLGFTFANYTAEIDAGRPVMLLCGDHVFVGYGYNTSGSICYIRTTWDTDQSTNHQMTWGGSYGDETMWAVSCMHLDTPPTKPDLLVKAPYDNSYTGGGVFNGTGAGQTVSRPCKPGSKAVYLLQIQNASIVNDTQVLTGGAGPTGWTVTYWDASSGGSNVTSQVIGSGWVSPVLVGGASKVLRVEVSPATSVAEGASFTLTVGVHSLADPSRLDTVQITTKRYASGVDPTITPRNPSLVATRKSSDATKAALTLSRCPDDPFGCTYYTIWRMIVSPAGPWVQLTTVSPTTGAATYTASDSGLGASTNYRYGVRAYNGSTKSSSLITTSLVDPTITPRVPAGLTATRVSSDLTQATLVITKSPDDPYGCRDYLIERRCMTPTTGAWAQILDVPTTGAATYTAPDTGLNSVAAYQYRVRAANGTLYSAYVTAGLLLPSVTPHDPTLTAVRVTGNPAQANVTITKSSDDPTGCTSYTLERCTMTPTAGSWTLLTTITANGAATYPYLDYVTATKNYQYRARAYNGTKTSKYVVAGLSSPATTPRPAGISGVRATGDATKANLTITPSPDDPYGCTGYTLQKCCTSGDNTWNTLTTWAASGSASYTAAETGLDVLENYQFRVQANNGALASAWTTCTLTDPNALVHPVTNLTATNVSGSSGHDVKLSFNASPDDPTNCSGYQIYIRTLSPLAAWQHLGDAAAGGYTSYSVTIQSLDVGVAYRFGIRAVKGTTGYSGMVTVDVTTAVAASARLVSQASAAATRTGGAQIMVHLTAAAALSVDVVNVAGRVVGRVCAGRVTPAGTSTLLWDGRGPSGAGVPSGRYLVRLVARGPDGQQTQSLVPLVMHR